MFLLEALTLFGYVDLLLLMMKLMRRILGLQGKEEISLVSLFSFLTFQFSISAIFQ